MGFTDTMKRLFTRETVITKRPEKWDVVGIKHYASARHRSHHKLRGLLSSPNTDIYRTLAQTRQLSRYMCENDSFAAKYLELTSVYITGDNGIKIKPVVESRTGRRLETVQKQVQVEWDRWSEEASLDSKFTFPELEQMAIQSVARDGEAFFRVVVGKDVNDHAFALQPMDPELLDVEYNKQTENGNRIIMGIELDKKNRPVAYHFWNKYIDELSRTRPGKERERIRIPADEIIHIYDDPTGVQVRGLPWTTPALDQLVRLMEWQDDYSAGMKMAARTRLVLHNNEGMGDEELYDDIADDIVDEDAGSGDRRMIDLHEQNMNDFVNTTQSQILEVEQGKKLEALNIPLPTSGVKESAQLILQRIAAGLNVSYATLTSDGSRTSFSHIRHDSQVERDIWKQRQRWFIDRFHKVVFKKWIQTVVLRRVIELPDTVDLKKIWAEWHPRGFQQIDPVKDLKAYIMGIEQGLYSRTQVAAMLGIDLKETLQEIKEEREFAEKLGIEFPEKQQEDENEALIQQLLETTSGQNE